VNSFLSFFFSGFVALCLSACSADKHVNESDDSLIHLTQISQESLNTLAKTLEVKYQFLSNIEADCPDFNNKKVAYCYGANIHFTASETVLAIDWELYFSQVYPAYASDSAEFSLKHINGDIHQILPNSSFTGFKAGEQKTIKLWVKSTLLTESELMPNYWLTAKNLTPVVIESTRTKIDVETGLELQPYVVSFDNVAKQIKSAPNDINQYASPQWLYQQNAEIKLAKEHLPFAVIPTPKSLRIVDETARIYLLRGLNIHYKNITANDVSAAFDRLAQLGVKQSEQGISLDITLSEQDKNISGSYQLKVTQNKIMIVAGDKVGAFYGVQTLASLLTLADLSLPLVEINDQPRYSYRGQHLDVARNFHNKAMVLALIQQMSAYKLNKLHLHLAEDEGWRLQLPSFPRLTELGSKRCLALNDKNCMQPQLAGAAASDRDGFYSVADYQEILKFASRHYIQVIPSLDMPGHSRAAIKAMEARYQYYMEQENEIEAKRYLLSDFNDETQYNSIQNYNDNTINICLESSYRFVDRVLDDLILMHKQAEHPLEMYHIGADETAGAWLKSPVCQALVNDQTNNVNDINHLGAHFIERVAHMVNGKGIAVGGWNDGLGETRTENMPDNVYSYIWGALPWGAHQQVSEQARRGWKVVLAIPDVFYFDFPYEIDPKERGYNWASRRITSRSVYNFMPDNLPVHAEFRLDTLGQKFTIDDRVQKNENGVVTHQPLPLNYQVMGIQGQLWSETIRSESQAEYMIYPRLLVLAERAWHTPTWQVLYNYQGAKYDQHSGVFKPALQEKRDLQWQKFSNTLAQKELAKLDQLNIFYRVPTVGAKIISGKLHLNNSLVGLPMQYRLPGGKWQNYQQPVKVTLPVEVRAKTANYQRSGRSAFLQ
jgi:hexosaminidase